MSISARSILIGIANVAAILLVLGVIGHGYNSETKTAQSVLSTAAATEPELPVYAKEVTASRELRKSKGKGSDPGCIPLYPTPAPTKGKGKGSRELMSKGSKGKGSTSAAPSFFCSDAPSMAPSSSSAPSGSPSGVPSLSPSLSSAPSESPSEVPSLSPSVSSAPSEGKGKGKGSKGMGSKGMGSKGMGSKGKGSRL